MVFCTTLLGVGGGHDTGDALRPLAAPRMDPYATFPTHGLGSVVFGPAMSGCAIVPAYDAALSVADVVRSLVRLWPEPRGVIVVDDGSRDDTARLAEEAGAIVLRHGENRGKGAALRTAFWFAHDQGFQTAVTVDADGQHPPAEALRLLHSDAPQEALVLGIRDLVKAGAPRPNQLSNRISNYFLSHFAKAALADTQCGLRRYPIAATLAAGAGADGYAYEAEIILRSKASGIPVVEVPIEVIYPPEEERISHFHVVRDPARIIHRIVATLVDTRYMSRPPRQLAVPPRTPRARPSPRPGASALSQSSAE